MLLLLLTRDMAADNCPLEAEGTSPLNRLIIIANSGVAGYCILFSITLIAVIHTELGRTATSNDGAYSKVLHFNNYHAFR